MGWDDVRLIRLVEVELGTTGAEERSDDVIYFAVRKAIHSDQSLLIWLEEVEDTLTSFPDSAAIPLKMG